MTVSISNLFSMMKKKIRRPDGAGAPFSVNPLMIIAMVFAVSFAGRAIGIANAALNRPEPAKEAAAPKSDVGPPTQLIEQARQEAEDAGPAASHDDTRHSAAPVDDSQPVSAAHRAEQYTDLMAAIRERSAVLDDKSVAIEDRIRVLEILEDRIEEKLAELKERNEELSKLVSYANEASQEDITMLAKMYEQMKPQRAGEIFNQMNPAFAAGFLTQMNSENAALILTNMSTEKAYEASMIIASRNAAVHQ
ncbi:MAG: MotE family protein [Hyphococcus sp.]